MPFCSLSAKNTVTIHITTAKYQLKGKENAKCSNSHREKSKEDFRAAFANLDSQGDDDL